MKAIVSINKQVSEETVLNKVLNFGIAIKGDYYLKVIALLRKATFKIPERRKDEFRGSEKHLEEPRTPNRPPQKRKEAIKVVLTYSYFQ